jgi:hypothetical protein
MATSLTVYGLPIAASTLPTAGKLVTTDGVTTHTHSLTSCGQNTGFSELYALGTPKTWAGLGSIGTPSGNGWLFDSTSLQGRQILAGNWSMVIRMGIDNASGSVTASMYMRAFKRSSAGIYALIGSAVTLSGQTIDTITTYNFPTSSEAAMVFGIGDKLYLDAWLNITSNNVSDETAVITLSMSTSSTQGASDSLSAQTPGYVRYNIRDITTRVRLVAGITTVRSLATRLNLLPLGQNIKNLRGRLRLVASAQKDLAARVGIMPPRGMLHDLNIYKQQLVFVYNAQGDFLDLWRDAPLLAGFKEAINSASSTLRVQLPRSFDDYDLAGQPNSRGTIQQGNVVKYYVYGPGLPTTGQLRFQGVIDAFQPQITENGEESLIVTLTPFSSTFGDRGMCYGQLFGQSGLTQTYVDPIQMFNFWFQNIDPFTGTTYMNPLTLDQNNPTSSNTQHSYAFINQSMKSIFDTILQMLPANWFYRANMDNTVTLAQSPIVPQHTFVVGQHITAPSYKLDWTQLKNIVHMRGAGGLTAHVSGADVDTFGERLALLADTRVTDLLTLNMLAEGALVSLDQVQLRTPIRLIDYRGVPSPSIGYDIESIQVGDTCTILDPTFTPIQTFSPAYWDIAKWDEDSWTYTFATPLNQTTVISALTYNFDYVDLELANLQPNQDVALAKIRQQFQDFTMVSETGLA